MIVKAVLDSMPTSQPTSTTATRTDPTGGLGTGATPTEQARGSESIQENRAQHHELGKLHLLKLV